MASLKEIADRYAKLPDGIGRNVAPALNAIDSMAHQLGIGRLPFQFGSEFVGRNLDEEIRAQAERYIDREFPKAMGKSVWEFRDAARALVPDPLPKIDWNDRFRIPTIRITNLDSDTYCRLVGVRVSGDRYHRKAYVPEGGFKNIGMELVWMNDGGLNLDKSVTEVKEGLGEDEALAHINHGIGLLMARPELLAYHHVYLPGSKSVEEDKNRVYQTVAKLSSEDSDGSNPYIVWDTVCEVNSIRDTQDMTRNPHIGSATIKKTSRVPKI